MQTKELRINKTMRTGMILVIIAIITLVALAMTFAKYAVEGTGEDSARVAKWGLDQSIPNDLDLFDGKYTKDGSVTVDASDGSNVIAPGTSKTANITLANFTNNEAPEVMYHFEPSITIEDGYVSGATSLTDKLDALPGWNWTLATNGGTAANYKTVAALKAAVDKLQESDIAPNTMPATKTIQLGWTWEFDNSSAAGTWDASDTELGNLIASGQLSGMKVTLNLNAYQCQGCSTDVTLSGQVSQTDGTAVAGANVAYNYSSAANGTINATTESDGKYSMKVPTNTKGTLAITKDGYKDTTTEEFSVADQPVVKNVTNFDPKTEVEIPTAITGLKYNRILQTGVEYDETLIYVAYSYTGDVSATNAGSYSATFILEDATKYEWSDGTTGNKTISWEIAKADQSVSFTLDPSSFSSTYSDTEDASATFAVATGQGSITYSLNPTNNAEGNIIENAVNAVSSLFGINNESNTAGIKIPDQTKPEIVCGSGTAVGSHQFTVTASASGDDNYNAATSDAKAGVWTVTQAETKKAIQSTIDGQTVNFLPAKAEGSWKEYGLTFYVKGNDETYTELGEATGTDITSMSNLATAIANIDTSKTATENAAKVYVENTAETTTTFYGTLNRSWNTTFIQETYQAGLAEGLTDSMKTLLKDGGDEYVYKTVYGDYVDGVWVNDGSHNWDANDTARSAKTQPDLNGVGYNSFYSAYGSLLGSGSTTPWSSRMRDSSYPYLWSVDDGYWSYGIPKGAKFAVVLTKDF